MSGISSIDEMDFDAFLFTGALPLPQTPQGTAPERIARRRLTFDASPTDSPPSTPEKEITDLTASVATHQKAGEKADGVFHDSPLRLKRRRSFDDHSPADDPAAEIKADGVFHPSPQKRMIREIHVQPPTPKKFKGRSGQATQLNPYFSVVESFGTALPLVTVDPESDPIQFLQSRISLNLNGALYQLPTGKIVAAVQQPIQEKPTCGPGCVLMLGLGNIEQMIGSDDFWTWYSGTRLANGESIATALRHLSIPATICRLTRCSANISPDLDNPLIEYQKLEPKEAVAFVKKVIEMTGKPVILAITHPILKGHWIIVDGFQNGSVYIRDPYTRTAFALPEETLSKWLLEKDPIQEMVYFPTETL